MAAANLLTLLDDIATLLDDVAVLSKVAMKKTTGVLADDLALNAEQVSGVKADRELPVVWAVAKGSLLNKLFLVPAALLISWLYPPLITVLLVIGGGFLCYEGAEKLHHKITNSGDDSAEDRAQRLHTLSNSNIDLVALEQRKIKGAIRTDFILSAEIVVIVLGTLQNADFSTQVAVLSMLAIAITFGIYGLVALIVKLDDIGLYLLRQSLKQTSQRVLNGLKRLVGRSLLILAPALMKLLSLFGTLAMFLVGGGILTHSIALLHAITPLFLQWLTISSGTLLADIIAIIVDGVLAVLVGAVLILVAKVFQYALRHQNAGDR